MAMKKIIYNKLQVTKTKPTTHTPKAPAPKQPYLIIWRDAYTAPDEWYSSDYQPDNNDYLVYTVGYIVDSTKEYYTIAATVTQDKSYCSILNIPKKMIVQKQKLTILNK
jgi:hypothetical protein